jgi:hypothetical protein
MASDLSIQVFETVLERGKTREPRVYNRGDPAKAGLTRMSEGGDKRNRRRRKAPGADFCPHRSLVAKLRLALFKEGRHALGLVFGREQRVEQSAFEQKAFVQRRVS